jgi:hypothetical protein
VRERQREGGREGGREGREEEGGREGGRMERGKEREDGVWGGGYLDELVADLARAEEVGHAAGRRHSQEEAAEGLPVPERERERAGGSASE